MTITTVSSKGQIVIPAKIRKCLGLKPQTKLVVKLSEDGRRMLVEPLPEDPIESACGFLEDGGSLSEGHISGHEAEPYCESAEIA